MNWARAFFKLHKKDQQGLSKYDHLKQVEKQSGKRPKELELPPFPKLLSHVWTAFVAMSGCRRQGFNGPEGLSFQDVKAYIDLMNDDLLPKEIEVIFKLDKIYLEIIGG